MFETELVRIVGLWVIICINIVLISYALLRIHKTKASQATYYKRLIIGEVLLLLIAFVFFLFQQQLLITVGLPLFIFSGIAILIENIYYKEKNRLRKKRRSLRRSY